MKMIFISAPLIVGAFFFQDMNKVYINIPVEAHSCPFITCPLKGEIIFSPTKKNTEEAALEYIHWENPNYSRVDCIRTWKNQLKYVNL